MTPDLDFQNPENYTDIPSEIQMTNWIENSAFPETDYSISVRVVAKKEGQTLNQQFRDKDYATNVLSFPFDPPPIPMTIIHLGDLVLCKPIIEKEALEQHKLVNDHWAHMIIHGTLHLQGYDHNSSQQATIMEGLEISLLKELGISNPYII